MSISKINEVKFVLTATTLIARGFRFRPDGTREDSSGRRNVGGGVNWNCRGRALKGGGNVMWRNADGLPIEPIVRQRIDHRIVLEGELGDSRLGSIVKHGRIGDHGIVRRTDIIVSRVEGNIAKGAVGERRVVVGSRNTRERVFSVVNVLGEARRRVCGFG